MPELPEVETIRQNLEYLILNKRLIAIDTFTPEVLVNPDELEYVNQTVERLQRVGKYLVLHLEKVSIIIHLRMTGKLLYHVAGDSEESRFMRARLKFEDGSFLIFDDIRRFGRISIFPLGEMARDNGFATLGPDAVSEAWTEEHFLQALKNRKKSNIKALLLDQTVVAGIGNIYADEALFRAGIKPDTLRAKLTQKQLSNIQKAVKETLKEAIGLGGTSFSDYVNSFGQKGKFQLELCVYQRDGKPCKDCGTTIEKIKVAGRGTRYCPKCQKN